MASQQVTSLKKTKQTKNQPQNTNPSPLPLQNSKTPKPKKPTKKKVSSLLWAVNTVLLPCPKWEGNYFWKWFQNWMYLRPPPLRVHPQTHALAGECKWMSEKPSMQTLAGILPLLCYTIKLDKLQGPLPAQGCARSHFPTLREKQENLSYWPQTCQYLPLRYRHEERWPTQMCISVLPFKLLWHDQMAFCVCLV